MMRPTSVSFRTRLILAALIAAVLTLGFFLRTGEDATRDTARTAATPQAAAVANPVDSSAAPTDKPGNMDDVPTPAPDIFAVRSWEPPPPPPPPPAPPPPPQAPPLPFRFIGRIADGADVAYMLVLRDKVVSARVGDTLDAHYFLEKAEGGQLHFLYRPLNIRQTLQVGIGS